MLSETGRIIFYDQRFTGAALPETEDNVSEESRLRAAPIGLYEIWFRQQPRYDFSGALFFNKERLDSQGYLGQKQFEVLEDVSGIERTLRIQRVADDIDLRSIEVVPLDWRANPLQFTQVAVSESERTICYSNDPSPESLRLTVPGLSVFDVEIVSAALWANSSNYVPAQLATFIRRPEDIRIDRLHNPNGSVRKLEEHLVTFIHQLLEKVPERNFDFECGYRYEVAGGVPHNVVPVLFRKSMSLSQACELFSSLLPELESWHRSFSPPEGDFNFGVKVYGAGARESAPVLHLSGLVLPIEAIGDWSSSSPI